VSPRWHFRKSEAGKIGRDHAILRGEPRDELAEHERRRGNPMQQEHDRCGRIAGGSIEHAQAIGIDHMDRCQWQVILDGLTHHRFS
jgi:hypothetical protein